MSKDYYKTLGVEKNASKDEIKQAFRKLAHEHHPDKGGDEAKFKEANEAYQVLGDETKRAQYDQFGSSFDGAGGFPGGAGGFSGFNGQGVNFEDLGDIFGDLFGGGFGGGGRGRARSARGSDIAVDVRLSFKESVFGVEKEIQITKNNTCERCAGIGGEPGTKMKTCKACDGSGMETTVQRTMFGNVQRQTACSVCAGRGEEPETKCTTCHGIGLQHGRSTLRVDIPSGVENGMKIRVRSQGESVGAQGDAGDLYLIVHVEADPRFHREGNDIIVHKKIGFTQAALGDVVDVDTVDGKVKLKVPVGIQPGDKLKLRGKGVQTSRGRGDQIVVIQIVTPKKLSKKEKKLLEELDLRE
ncbi:MAG: molecular chaperone DnaJ [Candidatus Uhrbacteria bacterium]|nr:molecular chaperone DnaJ [Candidatus Uhrbacteria bacterium]